MLDITMSFNICNLPVCCVLCRFCFIQLIAIIYYMSNYFQQRSLLPRTDNNTIFLSKSISILWNELIILLTLLILFLNFII